MQFSALVRAQEDLQKDFVQQEKDLRKKLSTEQMEENMRLAEERRARDKKRSEENLEMNQNEQLYQATNQFLTEDPDCATSSLSAARWGLPMHSSPTRCHAGAPPPSPPKPGPSPLRPALPRSRPCCHHPSCRASPCARKKAHADKPCSTPDRLSLLGAGSVQTTLKVRTHRPFTTHRNNSIPASLD